MSAFSVKGKLGTTFWACIVIQMRMINDKNFLLDRKNFLGISQMYNIIKDV